MPLINLQTDLKSLPFGRDRRESGDSNQPYITQTIPEGLNYDDMPGRGIGDQFFVPTGFLKPRETIRDVSRLTQMFIDEKSPRGLLFIAEQNLLSRTSVKTQAGGAGYGGAPSSLRPTGTLAHCGIKPNETIHMYYNHEMREVPLRNILNYRLWKDADFTKKNTAEGRK